MCETITSDYERCLGLAEWIMTGPETDPEDQVRLCSYHNNYFKQYGAKTQPI